jgi:hypothetical protein
MALLGDTAAVSALLDRLLHHTHVLTCSPTVGGEQRAHALVAPQDQPEQILGPRSPGACAFRVVEDHERHAPCIGRTLSTFDFGFQPATRLERRSLAEIRDGVCGRV